MKVTFTGGPSRHTVWKTERVNLPLHPEPGVVYRDVKVRLTLTSTIDELATLLREAKRLSRGVRVRNDDVPAAGASDAAPAAGPTPVSLSRDDEPTLIGLPPPGAPPPPAREIAPAGR